VFSGLKDLSSVHPLSFRRRDGEPTILSLGGRAWQVTHVDYAHKTAQVVPSERFGRSRWLGESQPLSYHMCQAIRQILLGGGPAEAWSRRALAEVNLAIAETNSLAPDALVVELDRDKDRTTWWTFAGLLANAQLAGAFAHGGSRSDNLSITITPAVLPQDFQKQLTSASTGLEPGGLDQSDFVKFQECLPEPLLAQMQASRLSDPHAVETSQAANLIFRDEE
jgi:ATP-dependent Lhr-like helicase